MKWLEDLGKNLDRLAGREIREKVMAGSENLSSESSPEKFGEWFKGAVERLDELTGEETRGQVLMDSCPEVFPPERIQELREMYMETGDLDDLIRLMHEDASWQGLSWYEYPERRGNTIFVRKIPYNRKAYEEAEIPEDKRYHYCHCKVVKTIMKLGEEMSPTFCHCGADWYRQLWQGILEKPIEMETLKSILKGEDFCEFLIHLPADA